MRKDDSRNIYGFTIVELLIVIVVIGVLATISLISYTGVSQRATVASLTSELKNASRQLKLDQIDLGIYPTSLTTANNGNGLLFDENTIASYVAADGTNKNGFCMSLTRSGISYRVTDNDLPAEGSCKDYKLALSLDTNDSLSYPGSGTTWYDLSGSNHDATLGNGVVFDTLSPKNMNFDGIDDYAIINENFISNPKSLTISSWFNKQYSNATYNCALHKAVSTSIGSSEYWLGVELNGKLTATIGATTGIGWSAGMTNVDATIGEWWNIVASWDGSVVKVYVNGQFNKQYNLTTYPNLTTPTRVGASSNGANYQFPGLISSVKIYTRPMAADEVLSTFDDEKSLYGL